MPQSADPLPPGQHFVAISTDPLESLPDRQKHDEVTEKLVCYIAVLMARKLVTVKIGNVVRMILAPFRLIGNLI